MASIRFSHFTLLDPRLAKKRKRRNRRLRPVRPSNKVRLWYREQLGYIVDHLRKAGTEVANNLRASWPEPPAHDAALGTARRRAADETDPRLPRELEIASAKFGNIAATAKRLTDVHERLSVTRRALAEVDARLAKAIHDSISVDIRPFLDIEGDISVAMRAAAQANVELIKSIPSQYFDQVRETVNEAFRNGMRWESMVARIKEVGNVTERRAAVISRDQASKMNASFNQARQTQVGIEKYTWSGVMDKRERASHRAMEGTVQRWASPPIVDGEPTHPGLPVLCRCSAVPLLDLDDVHGGGEAELEAA